METRKYYSQILDHFKLLKIRIERESNIINEYSHSHLEGNSKAFGWLIDNHFAAKEEIQNIYDMGNSEAIKNTIKRDYSELKEWLKVLVNTNMFILEKTPLDGNKIAHLNTIDTFEAKAVTAYATLENMIQMFYSPILEIWNGEKEPLVFDEDMWNEKTYRLFLYLCDNYQKGKETAAKYSDIWGFLKFITERQQYRKKGFEMNSSQKLYIEYIRETKGVGIKNRNKSVKYNEILFLSLLTKFESS